MVSWLAPGCPGSKEIQGSTRESHPHSGLTQGSGALPSSLCRSGSCISFLILGAGNLPGVLLVVHKAGLGWWLAAGRSFTYQLTVAWEGWGKEKKRRGRREPGTSTVFPLLQAAPGFWLEKQDQVGSCEGLHPEDTIGG